MRWHSAVAIASLVLLGLLIAGAGAQAQGLAGTYEGFYQSALSRSGFEPVSINIVPQEGGGFTGLLMVGGALFPLEGTIALPADPSQPATFQALGAGLAGAVHVEGSLYLSSDPSVTTELQANVELVLADGTRDAGVLDVVLTPR